jgi:hypothetical protein
VVTLQMETMQVLDVPIQELGMERGLVRILSGPPAPVMPLSRPVPARSGEAPPASAPNGVEARGRPQGPARGAGERRGGGPPRPQPTETTRIAIPPPGREPAPTVPSQIEDSPAIPATPRAAGHRRRRRRGGSGPRPHGPR